ncbi:hypothetical protein COLO4_28125 [Corchorus olitorius]|uniref:Integrase zinc-binding domain-containing protein n=1 Tax=Corchorus olitorius TaxID=93759 RepID=A0A1R3HN17_9ROSI|nr:hypothetical protein COLO4_28125 [Corchorus olitorius]
MTEIVEHLKGISPPSDPRVAAARQRWAARYVLIDDEQYKKSFTLPLLKCVNLDEADYVLKEIHEGVCGNHMGGRSLAQKALRQGFYWPIMKHDAMELVKRCEKCQKFGKVPRLPTEELNVITAPWPFAMWGLDLIGPLPMVW